MTDSTAQASSFRGRVRAPRGSTLSCKGWQQEAALRMLMNSLDPDVAAPSEGLTAHADWRPARDWAAYDALISDLRALDRHETLLVRSGEPAGILRSDDRSPRVLIAGESTLGSPKDRDAKREFGQKPLTGIDRAGLAPSGHKLDQTLGRMSATSRMYTGTQAVLQGTYQIFAAAARKHFDGSLAGKLVVAGGMGETGGAQPLAATLNGAAFLGIDVDPERIKRCVKAGYCAVMVNDLDESLRILKNAVRKREPASVGLLGNCADLIPALAERGIVPDLLTDQTSARDPLDGYVPRGLDVAAAAELRRRDPEEYRRRALDSIAAHVRGMLELQKLGAVTFDSGNDIRAVAFQQGVKDANSIPSVATEYLRLMFTEGRAPLLWVALSGEPSDIYRADELLLEMFPHDEAIARWIHMIGKRLRFAGLPSRTCWLAQDEAVKFGLALNDLVARGEWRAPFLIGRRASHGGPALPRSESEAVTPSGASWLCVQNGSPYSELAIIADGTPEMAPRIERVLSVDSGNKTPENIGQGAL